MANDKTLLLTYHKRPNNSPAPEDSVTEHWCPHPHPILMVGHLAHKLDEPLNSVSSYTMRDPAGFILETMHLYWYNAIKQFDLPVVRRRS